MKYQVLSFLIFTLLTTANSVNARSADPIFREVSIFDIPTGDNYRISILDAVFVRDTTNSLIGEAYKDPSGLIWGSLVPQKMNQYDADKYCLSLGARLPTRHEFIRLARFLGNDTTFGYNPYLAKDSSTYLLPGLSEYWYWTSTPFLEIGGRDRAWAFSNKSTSKKFDGVMFINDRRDYGNFMCVL